MSSKSLWLTVTLPNERSINVSESVHGSEEGREPAPPAPIHQTNSIAEFSIHGILHRTAHTPDVQERPPTAGARKTIR